jgi:hypothetical protein
MHAIRKGQVRWVAKGDPVAQRQFIHSIFEVFCEVSPTRDPVNPICNGTEQHFPAPPLLVARRSYR